MEPLSRRAFAKQTLGSLLTFALVETLFERDAFAVEAKPNAAKWLTDVNQLGLDLKGERIKQAEWQQKIEQLLALADVAEVMKLVDFDQLAKNANPPDLGVSSLRFKFQQIEGVPANFAYGKQIFVMKQGRSVVPHGHNNMATAFLILRGEFHGRHYDRLEDQSDHIIIKPTIDRQFGVGEYSSITDFKDNVHWFQATKDTGFILNLHALDVNPGSPKATGRVYLDPLGEKLEGGLIRARRIDHDEATKLYG